MNKLYTKNEEERKMELLILSRERYNLRILASSGQLRKTHLLRKIGRDIARLKTSLTSKVSL